MHQLLQQPMQVHKKIRTILIVAAFLFLAMFLVTSIDFSERLSYPKSKDTDSNPILVWVTPTTYVQTGRTIQCFRKTCDVLPASSQMTGDAYLFHATNFRNATILPLPRDRKTLWGILAEEAPLVAMPLMHERVLNLFNFSLFYNRHSHVPIPLMWMGALKMITALKYYVNTSTKNLFLESNPPVVFIQSDCDTATDREEYVMELLEYIPIDRHGRCLKNKLWPDFNITEEFFWSKKTLETIAYYKFFITIENSVCNDYVTEKIWRALVLGVVPIYFGSPLIRDWLPNNRSAILVEDFPTPQLLSAHLHELLQNDTKYEEYLEHKTKGLITNKRLLQEVKDRPYQTDLIQALNKFYCLICERLHDRNSSQVDIVTNKQFGCPLPFSMLTMSVNPYNSFFKAITQFKGLEFMNR